MSEKSVTRQQGGSSDGKNELSEPRDPAGACSGGKFVVSGAGEAYDVRARGPNRKFRMNPYVRRTIVMAWAMIAPVAVVAQSWIGARASGGKIVFAVKRSGRSGIYSVNADGSNWRSLTPETMDAFNPLWSPDGEKILFVSKEDKKTSIRIMDADGGNLKRLSDLGEANYWPAWSPDGKKIAFVSSRDSGNRYTEEVYVMDSDGRNVQRLAPREYVDTDSWVPQWSPDGTQILFVRQPTGKGARISVMDADGSNLRTVAEAGDTGGYYSVVLWSPDGRRIWARRGTSGEIIVMNLDGSDQRTVTQLPFSRWSLSPDGKRIAVADFNAKRVYLIDANGLNPTDVTHGAVDYGELVWSPDSKSVAFSSNLRSQGDNEHFVVRADGTGLLLLRLGEAAPLTLSTDQIALLGSAPQNRPECGLTLRNLYTADSEFDKGNDARAAELYESFFVCENNPKEHPEAVLKLAVARYQLKQYDGAYAAARLLIDRPRFYTFQWGGYALLARSAFKLGRFSEVVAAYRTLMNDSDSRKVNDYYRLGYSHLVLGDYAQALETFEAGSRAYPDNEALYEWSLVAAAGIGGEASMRSTYERRSHHSGLYWQARIAPTFDALEQLGQDAGNHNMLYAALTHYSRAFSLEVSENETGYGYYAQLYEGDYGHYRDLRDKIKSLYSRLPLKPEPSSEAVSAATDGELHMLAGRFQEARHDYLRATILSPSWADAHYNLALLLAATTDLGGRQSFWASNEMISYLYFTTAGDSRIPIAQDKLKQWREQRQRLEDQN